METLMLVGIPFSEIPCEILCFCEHFSKYITKRNLGDFYKDVNLQMGLEHGTGKQLPQLFSFSWDGNGIDRPR
jgi:hypothetical protein